MEIHSSNLRLANNSNFTKIKGTRITISMISEFLNIPQILGVVLRNNKIIIGSISTTAAIEMSIEDFADAMLKGAGLSYDSINRNRRDICLSELSLVLNKGKDDGEQHQQ